MILLTFLHLFRGYFASVQKKPREMMWVTGMLMGLTVMGLGLTGYLLPWTVVSKSGTDVSIGMLSFLPAQIGPILTYLIAGSGSGDCRAYKILRPSHNRPASRSSFAPCPKIVYV